MLWPEEFQKFEALAKNDLIGFVRGTLDRRRDPAELVITKIIPLEAAARRLTRSIVVTLNKAAVEESQLNVLLRHVRNWPGNLDLYFEITGLEGVRRASYRVGPALKIRYNRPVHRESQGHRARPQCPPRRSTGRDGPHGRRHRYRPGRPWCRR